MIILGQIFLLIIVILLAHRDGLGYIIYGKPEGAYSDFKNLLKLWHFEGALIYGLVTLVLMYFISWTLVIAALLLRLGLYDIIYNKTAKLPIQNFGTEALSDKVLTFFFGRDGVVKKSLFAISALIILNIISSLR